MEPVITIKDQHFYYAGIPDLVAFSADNKCAVIIDEDQVQHLLDANPIIDGKHINQIIVISEQLHSSLTRLSGFRVFSMVAADLDEAVRFAIFSAELNDHVFCITNVDKPKVKEIIELVMI
ncbi:MAG: hypothetical protein KDD41_05925 [Flavobacteriales bacterium]|nr:hypothetical protein [Flavobacteriales bacterium]